MILMQAFHYRTSLHSLYIVVSKVNGDSSSNTFTTIAIYSVQLYVWALAILSLIYLGDMLEWACRGCKW